LIVIMKKNKNKRVAVGMSGGVDSSVAAALLLDQGYDVVGVFMKFWSDKVKGKVRENICCSFESAEDARRVCRKLGIPFYVIDMKLPFKKKIVDNFVNEYECGRTPNPCVRCNQFIKFGELWKKLKPMGIDFVATGHFAKQRGSKGKDQRAKIKLSCGKDKNKDQSYFLHQIKQKDLAHILFPVGNYTKEQVRKLAQKYKLPTAEKKESQEICFVADNKIGEFLSRYIKLEKGNILEMSTRQIIGEHNGLPLYTIGQRKGIGLAGGPWYVVRLDKKNNTLWVSKDEKDILNKEFVVKKVNWISGQVPSLPLKCKCRVRYRAKDLACVVEKAAASKYVVKLKKTERAITPGQYCVFYQGDECLGGGEIV